MKPSPSTTASEIQDRVGAVSRHPATLPQPDGGAGKLEPVTVVLDDKGLTRERRGQLVDRVATCEQRGHVMRARLLSGTDPKVIIVMAQRIGRLGLVPAATAKVIGPRLARGEVWTCHVTSVTAHLTRPDRARIEVILRPPENLARSR